MSRAPSRVVEFIETFDRNAKALHSQQYNETQLRRGFIDPFFQDFSTRGAINNITFPFIYGGAEHRIMVTERSAVVLVENYNDDLSLELGLVLDTKKKIVEKLWVPIEDD